MGGHKISSLLGFVVIVVIVVVVLFCFVNCKAICSVPVS